MLRYWSMLALLTLKALCVVGELFASPKFVFSQTFILLNGEMSILLPGFPQ